MKPLPIINIFDSSSAETQRPSEQKPSKRHMSLSELVSLADLSKAQEFRNDSGLRIINRDNQSSKYSICSTDLKTLGRYGEGLELYFLLLKQLSVLFLIISFISAWPIYENYKAGGLGSVFQGQLYTYFSVANQLSFEYQSLEKGKKIVTDLHKNSLNLAIADGIYSLMFLAFILQYYYTSRKSGKSGISDYVTAGDYAVEVKGFPRKNIKLEKIRNHFIKYGEIAEIYLARAYNGRLNEFRKRAEISYKLGLKRLVATQKKKSRKGTISILEKAQVEFDENLNKDQKFADKRNDELPVIRAYIVFERVEDRAECLKDYKKTRKFLCFKRKQKENLMFKQKYPLLVKPATEPSDILWENLEISHFNRLKRRFLGFLMTLPVIFASIVIVYTLKSYSAGLPLTKDCKKLKISGNLSASEAKNSYQTPNELFCFCKQQNFIKFAENSDIADLCQDYLKKQSLLSLYRFLGSAGVIFINLVLKFIMAKLSAFERTSTETKQKLQTMTRVFIALFINTAILTLLSNADMQDSQIVKVLPFNDYFMNGNYKDFDREWYTEVGSIITATMIVNAISPHFFNLIFWYPLGCCRRRCCWKFYDSQMSLNEMFAGPEFNIATKTAQVLTTLFSCYLYSGGMPILNIVCFLTMFCIFWIDKTLILRHYRKPPFYSSAINERLVRLLPLAVMIHCGFSLYAYSASDIFPSSVRKTKNGNIEGETVPLIERIYRISGIINLILIFLSGLFIVFLMFILPLCGKKKNSVFDEGHVRKGTYSMELAKIKAQGLHSYNIMENQNYKPLIISLNSAASKVARLRAKQPPPSPASMDFVEEDFERNTARNEENNVLIP
jgi:hypothetical protein